MMGNLNQKIDVIGKKAFVISTSGITVLVL